MDYKKFSYVVLMVITTMLLSSFFTSFGINSWYSSIIKPSFTPPNYVFPIAWNIIYAMIVISFYSALITPYINSSKANKAFLTQLFLQILWCFCFFYTGYIGVAFLVILLLDITLLKTIRLFWKNKRAAYFLIPYFLWVAFASCLNAAFVYLNGYAINF